MHLFRLNQTINLKCQQQQNFERMFNYNLRFLIVGMFGSLISIISIILNLLLFYVFATSRKLRRQNYVNPVLLSFFDIIVSLIYLLISPVHFLAFLLNFRIFINFWTKSIKILFCFEQVLSVIWLIVHSMHRNVYLFFLLKENLLLFFTILLFAFLLKATLYFEINIFKLPNCSNFIESSILVLNFNNNKIIKYQSLRFWTRNILSIILPFIVLAYCNLCIVQVLRRRRRKKTMADYSTSINSLNDNQQNLIPSFNNNKRIINGNSQSPALCKNKFIGCSRSTKQRITLFKCAYAPLILDLRNKQNKKLEERLPSENSNNETNKNSPLPVDNGKIGVRIATRTLVMVVGCYLISNSLSTALNIWEYFDLKLLRQNNFHIYLMITDIAALLTICGCALRLPIYVSNDKRIRKAICRVFIRLRFGFCKNSKPKSEEILRLEGIERFLEKYSIAIVSNSLRSNLTGNFENKGINQLAMLLQNRRRFLVQNDY
uniref:G-protein coupled receptors family 1 profile domain-containing protein n=1 Tax=Meloidogyne enterolobii TaxID=390850 RepID=A0A6V7VY80_MELEN|nr:unnamed protein product [Meloidogyne enterolobii]